MKKVSLKTIAEAVGVSSATVSLVLNGKDKNGRVSSEISKKILEKAEELNYVPNALAKGLRVGKSKIIGLVIADVSNLFFGALALHIQEFAQDHGYMVIIGNTNEQADEMQKMIKFMYARQVDGIILTPTENSQHQIENLMNRNIPFVLVDRTFPDLDVNSVMIDNYGISYRSAEYLISLGCKNIGVITYKQDHFHISERKRGVVNALRDNGIYHEENIKEVRYNYLKEDIYRAIDELMSGNEKIDGIFFTTNSISIIGVKALASKGVHIQKDIQIMCFDENDAFDILPYKVPYIKQPIKDIAQKSVEMLISVIEDGQKQKSNVVLDSELILS
jgi:LacI family transcriptional regulator